MLQHSVAQLDKDSKSSIMELCIRAIGQHLTRVSDSSQVGAIVVAINQGLMISSPSRKLHEVAISLVPSPRKGRLCRAKCLLVAFSPETAFDSFLDNLSIEWQMLAHYLCGNRILYAS